MARRRSGPSDASGERDGVPRVPLEELLETADVVSLHLPLTAATARIMDAAAFARMRPGAFLVNTARGELVDEAALLAALERPARGRRARHAREGAAAARITRCSAAPTSCSRRTPRG